MVRATGVFTRPGGYLTLSISVPAIGLRVRSAGEARIKPFQSDCPALGHHSAPSPACPPCKLHRLLRDFPRERICPIEPRVSNRRWFRRRTWAGGEKSL